MERSTVVKPLTGEEDDNWRIAQNAKGFVNDQKEIIDTMDVPMDKHDTKSITIEPFGKRVWIEGSDTLLEAIYQSGIDINAICGGIGTCGACKVRMIEGDASPVTDNELKSLSNDNSISEAYIPVKGEVMPI